MDRTSQMRRSVANKYNYNYNGCSNYSKIGLQCFECASAETNTYCIQCQYVSTENGGKYYQFKYSMYQPRMERVASKLGGSMTTWLYWFPAQGTYRL